MSSAKTPTPKAQQPAAEWVSIESLSVWVKNPRKNNHAVDAVAKSIERFGFGAPLLARRETGEIIAGHTRLKAAIKLGMDAVPVRYLDLTESEAHALALADNKLGELADWDDEAFAEILRGMADDGIDMAGLGWTDSALTAMLDPVGVDDVKWKEFDETIGDDATKGKNVKCPHCGQTFTL